MNTTTRLVSIIGTGTRTLATLQIMSLIDYIIFRSLLTSITTFQPVGMLYENLFIVVQFFSITLLVVIGSSAEVAPVGLIFLLLVSFAAVSQSILECTHVFGSPPFSWYEAFFTVYFFALNLAIAGTALVGRFFFDWTTWDDAVRKYGEIGSLFSSAYAKIDNARVAILYFISEALIPAEVVTLTIYFIAIGAIGPGNYNITGWVFSLHLFGIIVSIAWHEMTRAFNNSTDTEKRLGLVHPPSRQSLVNIYTLLFFLDAAQLLYVQENDHSQLVVLRSFLCIIAGVYLFVCIVLGVKYDMPPRPVVMFYAIQFFTSLIVTVEGFWLVSYFCYAQATGVSPVVYWNLVHVLTISVAIATIFVAKKPLNAVAALGVVAFLVLCVDIIVLGRAISLGWSAADLFIQIVFMLISLSYILVAGIVWPGAFEKDGELYLKAMAREKLTADSIMDVFVGSYSLKGIDTEQKVQVWLDKVARRIYYIVMGPIKTIGIIELIFVVFYTIILGVNCTRPPLGAAGFAGVCDGVYAPLWYQWFYLIHFVSALSAFAVVSFELGMQIALMFFVVMYIACLIADSILMGFLWNMVSKGELIIQSLFFVCDFFQLLFFVMVVYRSDIRAFAKVTTMEKLASRISIKE